MGYPSSGTLAGAALAVLLVATTGALPLASAHEPSTTPAKALGKLSFPTSTRSAPAQAAFVEGMLLLHLFEYPSALLAFQRAQALDPGFAMAYWGEAMTHTHPIWNQQDMGAGRAALAKLAATPEARAAKAGTTREKEFLRITEILYGEGNKRERDRQVVRALESMVAARPQDDEAQLFLSLALLGVNQGVRDLPNYLRAADIAKAVYRRNPQHPGAAHYWIHGMDDPANAAGAIEAAQALSKIAPAAGHSQHMTSHIFMARGLWNDVVASNEAASRVVDEDLRAAGRPPYGCGHYPEWLMYAYFQQGREQDGFDVLKRCLQQSRTALEWATAHPTEPYLSVRGPAALKQRIDVSLVNMRATVIVESPRHRAEAAALPLELDVTGRLRGWSHFSVGLEQAWRGDLAGAAKSLAALRVQATALPNASDDDSRMIRYLDLMSRMLEGVIAQRGGKPDQGIALLRDAAAAYEAIPFDFGPPIPVKPPQELLGEMLLEAGKPREALAAFDASLRFAPERALSLAGRKRALALVEGTAVSQPNP